MALLQVSFIILAALWVLSSERGSPGENLCDIGWRPLWVLDKQVSTSYWAPLPRTCLPQWAMSAWLIHINKGKVERRKKSSTQRLLKTKVQHLFFVFMYVCERFSFYVLWRRNFTLFSKNFVCLILSYPWWNSEITLDLESQNHSWGSSGDTAGDKTRVHNVCRKHISPPC